MEKLIDLYLSFVNDFITLGSFAEQYNLEEDDALVVIKLGKKYHELNVELLERTNKLRL